MRDRPRNQLTLDLEHDGKQRPPQPAPEELLNALADLLLEALGSQPDAIPAEREGCNARQDHA
jgi:hypothetical protein